MQEKFKNVNKKIREVMSVYGEFALSLRMISEHNALDLHKKNNLVLL